MVALQVAGITLAYNRQPVLAGVSFDAFAGELIGLVGPNGSGKSTLIRGVCRRLTPKAGSVRVCGLEVAAIKRDELARLVAVVPQTPYLPESFTAWEIVLMGRTPHLGMLRYESARDNSIAWSAIELTGTRHLAARRVGELSGGERQLVLIARALTQEPRVLLLDEPTAHLDIKHQTRMLDLVRRLCREQGLACVAALHDLNLAAQYCDRLVMLGGGKVRAHGGVEEVLTGENIRDVYGAEVCIGRHPTTGLPVVLPSIDGLGEHLGRALPAARSP